MDQIILTESLEYLQRRFQSLENSIISFFLKDSVNVNESSKRSGTASESSVGRRKGSGGDGLAGDNADLVARHEGDLPADCTEISLEEAP